MDFTLTKKQLMLQKNINNYLNSTYPLDSIQETNKSNNTHLPTITIKLTKLKTANILIPKQFNKININFLETTLINEALNKIITPITFITSSIITPTTLLDTNSDKQKDTWLPQITNKKIIINVNINEHINQHETNGIFTNNNTLNKKTIFVLDNMDTNLIIITNTKKQLYLIQTNNLTHNKLKTINHTHSVTKIILNKTPTKILPNSINNRNTLNNIINTNRIILSTNTLKTTTTMLKQTIEYTKKRHQFNHIINSFQTIKHIYSEMATNLEPYKSLV